MCVVIFANMIDFSQNLAGYTGASSSTLRHVTFKETAHDIIPNVRCGLCFPFSQRGRNRVPKPFIDAWQAAGEFSVRRGRREAEGATFPPPL